MERYSNRECIYSGPNSDIYKALDDQTKKVIALKIVDVDLNLKPHNIHQEISILKCLNNDNVLQYLGSFMKHDDMVLVTPFYKYDLNKILSRHLKKSIKHNLDNPLESQRITKNILPLDAIDLIFRGLVRALNYLHNEIGVIHRDVKPGNIFFKRDDFNPVLGDFGISYPTKNPPEDEPVAEKYLDVCTGIYKPPELCFGITEYGFEVDVWSLAILLTLLYSSLGKSCIENEGNDLVLINSLFTNFGTPTLDPSSAMYWPEMDNDAYHFKSFDFTKRERRPIQQILPRCQDSKILSLFEKMIIYERSFRITSSELYHELEL
ncbi:uncharacterized protein PRCAT00004538001 [Priceomyces carsonii]|uniref:uncharacterized protein n=1 Tax=Priceomyces carsonii TaxID=28549 RepID=UPI002EDB00F3|nr:unnamed protein product [Priceomyces carsonii]